MAKNDLINFLLIGLCSNYNPSYLNSDTREFRCQLKTEQEVEKDVLRGKTLNILTLDAMPFSGTMKTDKGILQGDGIAFEILGTLQKKYGFSYNLTKQIPPIVGDEKNGALGKLVSREVDMVAAFLPVTRNSHEYVKWGAQMYRTPYYVLMKRPTDSSSGSGLLAPFDMIVWILILVSLVTVGPIMYLVMWLRLKLCPDENSQLYPLSSCVWFVYGALMKQGSTLNPISDSSRMLFATWWLFILILTAFYTANLTAFLTLSLAKLPINNINDVAKPASRWFSSDGGAVYYAVNGIDGDLNVLTKSVESGRGMFVDTSREATVAGRLMEGWLYLDDWYTLTRLMFDDYKKKRKMDGDSDTERCSYVLTEKSFLERSMAFAYQQDSNLPLLFDTVVQRFIESGILKHLMTLDLPDAVICPLNLGSKDRRLRNSDLFTTYMVVLTGFAAGLAVFLAEIVWRLTRNPFSLPEALHPDLISLNKPYTEYGSQHYFNIDKKLMPLRTPSALILHYS